MKKYVVIQIVEYDQEQIVEAINEEEAIGLAIKSGNWDDPIQTSYDCKAYEIKENE